MAIGSVNELDPAFVDDHFKRVNALAATLLEHYGASYALAIFTDATGAALVNAAKLTGKEWEPLLADTLKVIKNNTSKWAKEYGI